MSLERLTIVVPTYKRPAYIYRQVKFWAQTPVRLVILDGSPQSLSLDQHLFVSGNIIYHHSPVSIEQRLGESIAFIETDYVALISDDEFFLKSTCLKCINFLDRHLDYSACKGQAVGFGWTGRFVYGKQAYPELFGYSVDAEKPEIRMAQHMSPYQMASLWAIQRKNVFTACVQAIGSGGTFSTAAAAEIQVSLVTAFMGKIKVLDDLMWLRSNENRNIWWESGNISFAVWWRDARKNEEHKKFVSSACSFAQDQNGVAAKSQEVIAAIESYADTRVSNTGTGYYRLKTFILNLLSEKQTQIVKTTINKLREICRLKPLHVNFDEYIFENFPCKLAEVSQISKTIREFHHKRTT